MEHYINPDLNLSINFSSAKVFNIITGLNEQYSKIPNTKCLFCPDKCGVEADCCKTFYPPMYLSEFVNAVRETFKWDEEKQKELWYSCYESFLNPDVVKPCVLLNKNNQCSCYFQRPLSCRIFGMYSDREWRIRLKNVAERLGKEPEEVPFNKQCKNIEIEGFVKEISIAKGDQMLQEIAKTDINLFNDKNFGANVVYSGMTYIPFDAHYLLMKIGPESLEKLTEIRLDTQAKRKEFEEEKITEEDLNAHENNVKDLLSNVRKFIFTSEEKQE